MILQPSLRTRRGSTMGRGVIPPKLRLCHSPMWHETLFDELKASVYIGAKRSFQNTPKCVSKGSAPEPAGKLTMLPRPSSRLGRGHPFHSLPHPTLRHRRLDLAGIIAPKNNYIYNSAGYEQMKQRRNFILFGNSAENAAPFQACMRSK